MAWLIRGTNGATWRATRETISAFYDVFVQQLRAEPAGVALAERLDRAMIADCRDIDLHAQLHDPDVSRAWRRAVDALLEPLLLNAGRIEGEAGAIAAFIGMLVELRRIA